MKSSQILILVVFMIVGAKSFGDSLSNPSSFSNGQSYYDDCVRRDIAEGTCEMAANQYFPQDREEGDEGDDSQPSDMDSNEPPTDSVVSTDLVSQAETTISYEQN